MTARQPPPGHARAHRDAWAVLPFFVNGTLHPGERAEVEAHLAYCVACRAEVEMLRRVERGVRDAALETGQVDRAWRRLAADIAARPAAPPVAAAAAAAAAASARARWAGFAERLRGLFADTPGPARAVLAAQAALLVAALGALAVPRPEAPGAAAYQTLSAAGSGPPPGAALRVRFADDAPESRLRGLLLEAGLRIVDGPSAAGLYALAPAADRNGDAAAAVDRLRSSDAVRLIEVLPGAAPPAPGAAPP